MIKDENYYTVLGWMRNRLNLTGDEAAIYAIIYGFSQDGHNGYELGNDYLASWINKSDDTVSRVTKSLVSKGYISEEKRDGKTTIYKCIPTAKCDPPQFATPRNLRPPTTISNTTSNNNTSSNTTTSNNINNNIYNNINNKEEVVVVVSDNPACASVPACETTTTTTTTSFLLESFNYWWEEYGTTEWEGQKEQCWRYWNGLSKNDIERVLTHTLSFAPINLQRPKDKRKQPFFYLCKDTVWKNDLSTINADKRDIMLTGPQIDQCLKDGVRLAQVFIDGKYKIVRYDDAVLADVKITNDNWQ